MGGKGRKTTIVIWQASFGSSMRMIIVWPIPIVSGTTATTTTTTNTNVVVVVVVVVTGTHLKR
jgi:uncharacterized membrane protein